ncbi:ABC-type uncharacterized transport system, periplasmic component [Thiorhodovibrio winogradskyi]|uniref:ABC-type uncharacterized transport system, periplasmic component n=1 Tax=Thiorhodovibrio winogradskyi TaxID=77007 RepID=A0ABZ0S970_9GAMM
MPCNFLSRLHCAKTFFSGVILVVLLSLPALAHPHAWIDLRVRVMANAAGEVTGLYQEWLFDPYYSQIVLEDVGSEAKAATKDAWLAAIATKILKNLADYHYFTSVEQGDEPVVDVTRVRPR